MEPIVRRGLGDEVYDALRDAILSGSLEEGSRIGEVEFAESLKVSRGPLREALGLLRQDGLVQIDRHRGAVVTTLSVRDAEEIYSLRTAIEQLAARRVIEFGTDDDLARMRDTVQGIEVAAQGQGDPDLFRLDIQFHDQLLEASRHERINSVWRGLRSQTSLLLLRRTREHLLEYRALAAREHEEILDAIDAKDTPLVMSKLEDHMSSAYERAKLMLPEDVDSLHPSRET